MRKTFDWYLGAGEDEINAIWDGGLLTLDANVLLDLYRYNAKTREDIVKAVSFFGERVWLPAQAAREFIRNRNRVIVSADKTFSDANAAIDDLRKSYTTAREKLRGYRLMPREGLEEMSEKIEAAIDYASEKVMAAQTAHPEYLKSDPLLDWILTTFDGRLGAEPSQEEWVDIRKSGESRMLAHVPPGYEDRVKDGDQKYGDYLMWRQILDHARTVKMPIILVTSERKEDWWEVQSGKTIGPRPELLEEAAKVSGQRILIYQTDRFLVHALAKIGDQLDESSVDDIREVDAERSSYRYAKSAAVRVTSSDTNTGSGPLETLGTARVEILRPVRNFTATVSLDPPSGWEEAEASAGLVAKPADAPDARVVARVSSSGKIALHVHALGSGQFPPGIYEIVYSASILNAVIRGFDELPPLEDERQTPNAPEGSEG